MKKVFTAQDVGKLHPDKLSKRRQQVHSFYIVSILIVIIIIAFLITHLPVNKDTIDVYEETRQPQMEIEIESGRLQYHNSLIVDSELTTKSRFAKAEKIWKRTTKDRETYLQSLPRGYHNDIFELLHLFPPSYNCPHMMERIGDIHGGRWVCGMELMENKPDCVFYSFGISPQDTSSSFESGLISRTNYCKIHAFDHETTKLGAAVEPFDDRVEFQSLSIGTHNGDYTKKLRTILKQNDHGWVDILRIDIDGDEGLGVMEQILEDFKEVLPFSQLLISIRFFPKHSFEDYVSWFQKLEQRGLRPFHAQTTDQSCSHVVSSITFDYSFVNVRGKHLLLESDL